MKSAVACSLHGYINKHDAGSTVKGERSMTTNRQLKSTCNKQFTPSISNRIIFTSKHIPVCHWDETERLRRSLRTCLQNLQEITTRTCFQAPLISRLLEFERSVHFLHRNNLLYKVVLQMCKVIKYIKLNSNCCNFAVHKVKSLYCVSTTNLRILHFAK